MTEEEYKEKVYQKATSNHIWLNAFQCINPTDEFKIGLANEILDMLDSKHNTLPASYIISENEGLRDLANRQPILYLSINKS